MAVEVKLRHYRAGSLGDIVTGKNDYMNRRLKPHELVSAGFVKKLDKE